MPGSRPLPSALIIAALALAACGESPAPAQPEADPGGPTPVASLALAPRNSWTSRAPLPDLGLEMSSGRVGHTAGVANDAAGRPHLYLFGGITTDFENHWSTVDDYDLASDRWTRRGGVFPSYANGVGKIGNKLYLSGGGFFAISDGARIVSTLYAYDPATGRTTRKADMPQPTAFGVSGVINGRLYVLAGQLAGTCDTLFLGDLDCTNAPTRRFYRYDPATNAWATRPWAPHFHGGGAGGVIDGKLYVAGGGGAHLDVYDPSTNRWTTLAPMPKARNGAAGTVLGGRLYVIGGCGVSGSCDMVFAYDPVTNTWATKPAMPTARADLAVGRMTLEGKSYLLAVAGNDDGSGDRNEMYTP